MLNYNSIISFTNQDSDGRNACTAYTSDELYLVLLLKQLRLSGSDTTFLEGYVSKDKAAQEYADRLNLSVDPWKICLADQVFNLEEIWAWQDELPLLESVCQSFKSYDSDWQEELFHTIVYPSGLLESLHEGIGNWVCWLTDHYLPSVARIVQGGHISLNGLWGRQYIIRPNYYCHLSTMLKALVLNEEMNLFAHYVNLLGSKYGYELMSHCGATLIVAGELPDAAVREASLFAGLDFNGRSLIRLTQVADHQSS